MIVQDSSQNTASSIIDNDENNDRKTLLYPLDKYEIKVVLNSKNEFIGIKEININKSYQSYKQADKSGNFHDLSKLYEE